MSYAVDIFIVEGDDFGLRWSNWNVWKSKYTQKQTDAFGERI